MKTKIRRVKTNPYLSPVEWRDPPRKSLPVVALIRTALLGVCCVFVSIRDLPDGWFAPPLAALGLVAISFGAIRFDLLHFLGTGLAIVFIGGAGEFLAGFGRQPDTLAAIIYGGVVVPLSISSILYLSHLFSWIVFMSRRGKDA